MRFFTFFLWIPILFSTALAQDNSVSTLQEIRTQVIEQEEVQETIKKEKESASEELKKVENLAASAEKQAQEAESETEKALAEFLLALQSYRSEISNIKLNKISIVDSQIELMKEKTETLKDLEAKYKTNPKQLTPEHLGTVTEIWREIVDNTIANIFLEETIHVNSPPKVPSGLDLSGEKFKEIKKNIKSSLEASAREKIEIEQNISLIKRSQRDVSARLLLNAGRVRASIMNALIEKGAFSVWYFSGSTIEDYLREIKIVPHRLLAVFAEKYYDFRLMSQEGVKGWLNITKQVSLLGFVLLLPFLLFGLFKAISNRLDLIRKQIFTTSQMDFKKRIKVALWIGRLNPYLPWFFAYMTVDISYSVLLGTLLEPLTILLPYLKIYILYRGFLTFFSGTLAKVLLYKSLDKLRSKQSEVKATAFKLSVLFFLEWAFLHAVEDAVRQALIYNLIFDVMAVLNISIIAFEARKWKADLLDLSENWLSPKLQDWLRNTSYPLFDYVFYPLLFLGNMIFLLASWIYHWLGHFEVGKKISSEIFKRRLEDANEDQQRGPKELDNDYKQLFLGSKPISPSVRVSLSRSPFRRCVSIVDNWRLDQTTDDLVLLYGNQGIGKTTLLSALDGHFQNLVQIKKITFKSKITKSKDLFKLLSEAFQSEIHNSSDFESLDRSLNKTLLVLDDIHNLYLNMVNGLEAYRGFVELTSLQLQNIFWCLSCNERAMAHLDGIFGKDHLAGTKIELLSWTDSEIQELIMKRHRQSEYKLKFDQVISAVHRGDILESSSGLEVQFFRLLWGQSRGNPSTAQELWLSAASKDSADTIRITVPEFTNPRTLSDLSDEIHIVYAAIVKHEYLSFNDILKVSEMPISVVRQAIKFGEDGMILKEVDKNQWRIHPKAQYVVHAQLIGRNLIYG